MTKNCSFADLDICPICTTDINKGPGRAQCRNACYLLIQDSSCWFISNLYLVKIFLNEEKTQFFKKDKYGVPEMILELKSWLEHEWFSSSFDEKIEALVFYE